MMRLAGSVILTLTVLTIQAQVPDVIQQAQISGSRGTSGKCTIEVRVDMVAEVDVYGNAGRLRTLAGQPATWTRFECTDPLPYNMSDFKFRGVDGRGKVQLAQDPRNNRSIAVIRIEDPRSGSEGYTFDIEWSGASGGAPTDGFNPTPTPAPITATPGGRTGFPGRRGGRRISSERAIDLCRTEVRARAERDYNLRNIDITGASVDASAARGDLVTGTFNSRTGSFRRSSGYRFNCTLDTNTEQVRTVEILRADGTALSPAGNTTDAGSYDQNRVFRACQDAVVARTGRDGYENVRFSSIAVDPNRRGWVTGSITGSRGPVSDTFDFACSMDMNSAVVRNVELNRR